MLTSCVLVDGVFLPWIIIGLNRTMLSYTIFTAAFVLVVFFKPGSIFGGKELRRVLKIWCNLIWFRKVNLAMREIDPTTHT